MLPAGRTRRPRRVRARNRCVCYRRRRRRRLPPKQGRSGREMQRRGAVPHPAEQAVHVPDGFAIGKRPRRRSRIEAHDSGSAGLPRMTPVSPEPPASFDRQQMEVDIACVGFGPAMGGFLTTLSRSLLNPDGSPRLESSCLPGTRLQVICYERSDGLGFGVSGAVTRGRGIRRSFPGLDLAQIPMATQVKQEKLVYLLDPTGASNRSFAIRAADKLIRTFGSLFRFRDEALELPLIPSFLQKHDGFVMSLGQFNQWVAEQLTSSGLLQIWPGTPVSAPLIEDQAVKGIRLADQGTALDGTPQDGFLPGMDIRAALTVVGDGPVGAVGRGIDAHFGLPAGHEHSEWALGMKMVIELREDSGLEAGTVLHTFGFPEPEIFGFLYVHPDRLASVGIFIPSWFRSPVRTAYRYLQHFVLHPYLWRHLQGGTLNSWGAKSLQESGRRGEPFLVGDGYARIGEGSGSTNVLSGSGVDEAWTTARNSPKLSLNSSKRNCPSRDRIWKRPMCAAAAPVGWTANPGLLLILATGFRMDCSAAFSEWRSQTSPAAAW